MDASGSSSRSTNNGGSRVPVKGQEAVFLGAWDFVLLTLLAVVLLWVLPKRLLRLAQRWGAGPGAAAPKRE